MLQEFRGATCENAAVAVHNPLSARGGSHLVGQWGTVGPVLPLPYGLVVAVQKPVYRLYCAAGEPAVVTPQPRTWPALSRRSH